MLQPDRKEAEEESELNPFQYRPGDSVISIRRRIQKERREQYDKQVAENQLRRGGQSRSSAQSAMSVAEISEAVDHFAPSPSSALGDTPFLETELDSSETGGRRKLQVARFHRDMIRKEVWRQKFDFLFRQMQQGVESEMLADRQNGRSTQSGPTNFAEESTTGDDQAPVEGTEREGETRLEAAEDSLRESTQQRDLPSSGAQDFRDTKSASGVSSDDTGLPWLVPNILESQQKKMPATMSEIGWRRISSRPKSGIRARPSTSVTRLPQRTHTGGSAKPKQEYPSTGIGGLLRSSKSLPHIRATPGLQEVREEYYGGDDLFMHEDVLHASNPGLFPLRVGHGKPFPLLNLDSLSNL